MKLMRLSVLALILPFAPTLAHAQDNYEIQVYGVDTVPPASTMVELHSNFTAEGSKTGAGTVCCLPITPNMRRSKSPRASTAGLRLASISSPAFSRMTGGSGWATTSGRAFGSLESWHWPVGVSLSNEIGYQRAAFSPDTWTWEIRPIVDKKIGAWYLSFNPTLDRSFHGPSVNQGVVFSPNAKFSYDFTKRIAGGLEYYGSLGPITGFDPLREQQQQIFPTIDLDLGPKWEFNFGVGVGMTGATDHLIIKCILGRRFSWGHGS